MKSMPATTHHPIRRLRRHLIQTILLEYRRCTQSRHRTNILGKISRLRMPPLRMPQNTTVAIMTHKLRSSTRHSEIPGANRVHQSTNRLNSRLRKLNLLNTRQNIRTTNNLRIHTSKFRLSRLDHQHLRSTIHRAHTR